MVRSIPVGKNLIAWVDDDAYVRLSKFTWFPRQKGKLVYAVRRREFFEQTQVIYMHREIFITRMGDRVDHIDGNGLNNVRSNLILNSPEPPKKKHSQYKGVTPSSNHKNPWRAQINTSEGFKHIGCFATEEEAALAFDKAAVEIHGESARVNFPIGFPE